MNKKGFLTRDIVITGILFTGLVALFVLAIAGVANNYNDTNIINEEFSDKYDKLTEVTNQVELGRSSTQSGQGLSFLGTFDVVFSSTFTVVSTVFATFALYGSMTSNFIADFTFLDASVISTLFIIGMSIITTIIVFIWISSISRGKI